ncbi:NAD(P)-dependent oxidoreductase [Paucibacter sp. R3-3]|uniref:NAD(P)-dependent oxidoreductase n=1 Tax=Roseateles agri TaxID=3098619 RepID=A0ABU5DHL0_9BURK|nr:NAD(P)-dependent oxidoreductase [Paucibacter sp. R3-3]MDY0745777.1 NAD(P)-dependent oxidoreductase [Paucibacter sp. R3-3]
MSTSNEISPPQRPCGRLLLTGAAGGLGRVLRERLVPMAKVLRVSDLVPLGDALGAHEELRPCDLADKAAVQALLEGCDAVVHLGGVSVERSFEEILQANLRGVFHLYEAARLNGVRRVVFASSNHAIGFYRQAERIGADVRHRPDGFYGLSKCFGEDMAQLYFDRYGIETVSIRIGSSFEEPKNRRMLHTWLSFDDLTSLVEAALFTPQVGHTIVYGASKNGEAWWDNAGAGVLGWAPKDNSELYRAKVEAEQPPLAADDPNLLYQGGVFTTQGPY